ncbi:hypothetical protein DY000_02031616 [Brassica cretica]|uniref:Arabidopsis retrotransposon Orf1 C-terminal domain-containing protein n=1 Tax=Brassica cretica TaxID=69181 RepID=A0ABQ7DSY3_BRACR|nr:hypothetical protein DY000_02031616 [Brassica cretica]
MSTILLSRPPLLPSWPLASDLKPRSANQFLLRNPSIRIIAKVLSNLLFAKDQTSKVTNGELQMLYSGLEDQIWAARTGIPVASVRKNPDFLLAEMFSEKQTTLRRGSQKKDRCGSLLTPLIKKRTSSTVGSLSKRSPVCTAPLDVEMGDTTPDEYDLRPIEYDADAETYRRWMIDSQHKNNSLMNRILRAITGGCFQSQTSEAEQANTPQPNRRAGKEPAESSAGGKCLGRNRRDDGHSGSGDSD